MQLDTRIEKQVEELVKMLSGLRDSQESRTRVTQLKKSAVEGLKRGIDLYVKKRKEIRELVRTGGDESLEDLGKIDQRILKGVDQIADAPIWKGSRKTWPPARSGWKRTPRRNPTPRDSHHAL